MRTAPVAAQALDTGKTAAQIEATPSRFSQTPIFPVTGIPSRAIDKPPNFFANARTTS